MISNKSQVKCECEKWFSNPKFNNLCSECYNIKYPEKWKQFLEKNWTPCSIIPKHVLDKFIDKNKSQFPKIQWNMILSFIKDENDIIPLINVINYIKKNNKDLIGITAEQGSELYSNFKKYHSDKYEGNSGANSDWKWQHLFAGMIFDNWNIKSDKNGPIAYCYYSNFGAKPTGRLIKENIVSTWICQSNNNKKKQKRDFWLRSLPKGFNLII